MTVTDVIPNGLCPVFPVNAPTSGDTFPAECVSTPAGAALTDVVSTRVLVASSQQADLVAAWEVVRDAFGDAGRYGWIGGYGTAWFNDPNIGLTGIMMSQVQMDSRSMEATGAFYRAAYAALAWPERR